MVKAKVLHFKKNCIACGACAAINPDFWSMDEDENGFSSLKGSKKVDDHYELELDSEADIAANQETADVCPVGIIQVKKEK